MPPARGDQVFFAAAAEATLHSLAAVAAGTLAPAVDVHLLFHFNPLAGRPLDYARQAVRRRHYARAFDQLGRALSAEHLHYFATTDELTDQFEVIRPGHVATLGYPLDPAIGAARQDLRGSGRFGSSSPAMRELIRDIITCLRSSMRSSRS